VNHQSLSAFIWSVADLLRGDYKRADYGKVILPFTVLRRLDCVLEPTKAAVLVEHAERKAAGLNPEPFVLRKAGRPSSTYHRRHRGWESDAPGTLQGFVH
jgi:type I restriction enzyme M protein